jgi:hypothetical protein
MTTKKNIGSRNFFLYIVYGENQAYYNEAKFSILTLKNWIVDDEQVEIVILTERPDEFREYKARVISLTKDQTSIWSLRNKYHFRIKNRGMAFVMDTLNLKHDEKIIFLDTDTYFHKSPLDLFNLITSNQALMYLNEGHIYSKNRFLPYIENLEGLKIKVNNEVYQLSRKSVLWGSLMIGLKANMRMSLEWADQLMLELLNIVPVHTIEEFALSESLLKDFSIVEGKKYVSLYSTSRKKKYARNIISNFFYESSSLSINQQILLAQKVKLKRSFYTILKQRFFS